MAKLCLIYFSIEISGDKCPEIFIEMAVGGLGGGGEIDMQMICK